MPDTIPEIIVFGSRPPRFTLFPIGFGSRVTGGSAPPLREREPTIVTPAGDRTRPPSVGFVPPVVPPQLLPEVVVKGVATSRPFFGLGAASVVSVGTLLATVGGVLVAKILEERGQEILDREFRELMAKGDRVQTDSPLVTMQPEVLPEIVVTGSRLQRLRNLLRVTPQPFIFISPDFVPDFVEFTPRELPAPTAPSPLLTPAPIAPEVPLPTRRPINVPTRFIPSIQPAGLPTVAPARVPTPRRRVAPATLPSVAPGVRPGIQTFVQPSTSTSGLTGLRASTVQSTRLRSQSATRAQLNAAIQGSCVCPKPPKCKKEREKPRTECFKKLVKEGITADLDTSFNWVEIDCLTGSEL